jgi:hypothetical protein
MSVTRYSPCFSGSSTGSIAFAGFGGVIFIILSSPERSTLFATGLIVRRYATSALESSFVIRL